MERRRLRKLTEEGQLPDFRNTRIGPELPPSATALSQVVIDVLSRRLLAEGLITGDATDVANMALRSDAPVLDKGKGFVTGGKLFGLGPLYRFDKLIFGHWDESDPNKFNPELASVAFSAALGGVELYPPTGNDVQDGALFGSKDALSYIGVDMAGGVLQGNDLLGAVWDYWRNDNTWQPLTVLAESGTAVQIFKTTGIRDLLFKMPSDAARSTATQPGFGVPAGYFIFRWRGNLLAGARPVASRILMGHPLRLSSIPAGVVAGSPIVLHDQPCGLPIADAGDGLIAAWETADAANRAEVWATLEQAVQTIGA